MAFVRRSNTVISFATPDDLYTTDQRVFSENESHDEELLFAYLIKSTSNVLEMIRRTDWWKTYFSNQTKTNIVSLADVPLPNANLVIGRTNDFTDIVCYHTLANYYLPSIADFGSQENSEYKKIHYYNDRVIRTLESLVGAGDWYDFNSDGNIQRSEKQPGQVVQKRIR